MIADSCMVSIWEGEFDVFVPARSGDLAILAIAGMFTTYSYVKCIAKIAKYPELAVEGVCLSVVWGSKFAVCGSVEGT